MPNAFVVNRLKAIQQILIAGRSGGDGLAPSVAGGQREAFINLVLANALAPPFRTGTGEITDDTGRTSDQIDIVVEYAGSLSFPLLRGDGSRLYLAEGVCAAFEVKSDLIKQWQEVVPKASKVRSLTRKLGVLVKIGAAPPDHIPFFAVGYSGWSKGSSVDEKLASCPEIDGILVIGPGGIYRGRDGINVDGPEAIFGLLLSIEGLTSSMLWSKPTLSRYIR